MDKNDYGSPGQALYEAWVEGDDPAWDDVNQERYEYLATVARAWRPIRPRSWRCRFGLHAWFLVERVWRCYRCDRPLPACSNCGNQHNPHALITRCTVTRSVGLTHRPREADRHAETDARFDSIEQDRRDFEGRMP